MQKQISMCDYDIQLTPETVPEKYKDFVHFHDMNVTVYYDGFTSIDLKELIKIDEFTDTLQSSQINLMLQINKISEYLIRRERDINGCCKSSYFYDLFIRFYGISKTNIKNCLRVYKKFWVVCSHVDYENFSFSQLVEMCTLTTAEMHEITPDWTVRQIRDYKKHLIEESKPKKNTKLKEVESKEIDEDIDIDEENTIHAVSKVYMQNLIDKICLKCQTVLNKYKVNTPTYNVYKNGIQMLAKELKNVISSDDSFS